MQPDLPTPSQNPYDFIMNSGQPTKPGKTPGAKPQGGNGMMQKIIVVVGGMFILVIVGIVVFSLISSAGKAGVTAIRNLAHDQAEIIRVSDLGVTGAKSSNAKDLAATTALVVRTQQQRTIKLLTLRGEKIVPKELTAKKNEATDAELKTAELNNRYDEALTQYLTTTLGRYQAAVKLAYDANTGVNDRSVLGAAFTDAGLILKSRTPTTSTN
jgi:hypothetical protein